MGSRVNPTTKQFLRCPTCTRNVAPEQFTRGALGVRLQALTQTFCAKGEGTNGGAFIWDRRSVTQHDLEHMARALAKSVEIVGMALASDIIGIDPARVLADIDNDEAAAQFGLDWLAELDAEKAYRERLVTADYERRLKNRRYTR